MVSIMLHDTEIEPDQIATAFVGVTIKYGATATCAANYAQDLESPESYEVMTNEGQHGEIRPEADSGVGLNATVPGGSWSLCGWIQPEGNTSTAIPSAVYGPAKFTVGGPGGTSSIAAPTVVPPGDAVIANVQYSTDEILGEFSGSMTSLLYVAAYSGSGGCASSSSTFHQNFIDTETQQGSFGVSANQSGSTQFGAMLPPGVYSLCAWMWQTFPSEDNTPGILSKAFATSSMVTTVLAPPSPNTLPVLVSRPVTVSKSRTCNVVKGNGLIATISETASSCGIARVTVVKLLRKIGRPGGRGVHNKTVVRISVSGGDFVCRIQDASSSRYTATCERGHAVIVTKVTLHQAKKRRK